MTDARALQDLARGLDCDLTEEAARGLLAYLDAMLAENQRVNLTAVRDREAAVGLHVLDSLALGARHLGRAPSACLDLGTGNGFPGVAALCLFPQAEVLLVDRTLKKLRAIERALEAAGLASDRVRVLQMDAAELPAHGHRGAFDLVTARAVGEPRAIGALARPLLRPGGSFLCWLSRDQGAASEAPRGYRPAETFEYVLPPPADRSRVLARYALG